mmetsp:Transcript_41639/g.75565  ORF Transcript_41639/g.75565 Transcript_41639/m.75565 type:complete len:169 (-) Transcript_41639:212-718(-)
MRQSWRRPFAVLVAFLLHSPGRAAPLSNGSPALKMLLCDSCQHVMQALSKDVKYLVETGKMWKPTDLKERILASCEDPAIPNGAGKEACAHLVTDHSKVIAEEVSLRWREDSEEFEEDIVPKEFCYKVQLCKDGDKNIGEMINRATEKEKALKEEQAEKERKKSKTSK